MNHQEAIKKLEEKCNLLFGCTLDSATTQQAYRAVCLTIRDILTEKHLSFVRENTAREGKQVHYLSMEFLVGTSLRNNLFNLGLERTFEDALSAAGINLYDVYKIEPDAGLGNGGLGRLASCYMDAATTQKLPFTGYSIRYEFGIFKQKIADGWQIEFPDDWLNMGEVWLQARPDDTVEIPFGGRVEEWSDENGYHAILHDANTVLAVPYDMMISGYRTDSVNRLVLWSAKSSHSIDMNAFSRGEYVKALEENTKAEVISKVLYPADDHMDGKILRIRQQYFFVSASLQSITKKHMQQYGTMANLPDKHAIHINDTHPALAVPELMRILLDVYGLPWDEAWDITARTLTYTNHTIMQEALERWNEVMFREQLPRIHQIVAEINRRLLLSLHATFPGDQAKIDYMSVITGGEVRMANLCLAACHRVNGVSKLHSDILKNGIFRDYYSISPQKFCNVTNGIAHRRWLGQANPELCTLLETLIGDGFLEDATRLSKLVDYYDDATVLENLRTIKRTKKIALRNYISGANGINVDENSIFDVQIKRLHEYKRQLLNALNILHLYRQMKDSPSADFPPRTFIFAAKASSGYFMAKQIIRLIVAISNTINADPSVRDKLKVVFLEDYKVSLAEMIIPAADISEQISVAGKEASGTGNMKLMINGAVTIGTLDGANVEICQAVGKENMFLFGMTTDEVEALWRQGYMPSEFVRRSPALGEVIDMLTSGILGARFDDIAASLLSNRFGAADAYMTLADFDSYAAAQERIATVWKNSRSFTNMSLVNIAKAGIFSADRAIKEYRETIWHA
ncbi:MAG: glycogen/starch/alpha-glucan phosphorylase [Ruminococcaceae bacterium]|nr:glycogen/starch/alpha-glucan phosphorylase [Oscillospiraceae bacterium]